MNWYIGQKVVSVEDNIICNILDIRENKTCNCATPELLTDHPKINDHRGYHLQCPDCGWLGFAVMGKWRHSDLFRPLEDNFAEQALNKAIEQAEEILEIIETVIPVGNSH